MNDFPRTVQDAHTGEYKTVHNTDDVWSIIYSWPHNVPLYTYAMLLAPPWQLIDSESQQMLNRYHYSKEFGVPPYAGAYDDQPAVWVDAVSIIAYESNEAAKAKDAKRQR